MAITVVLVKNKDQALKELQERKNCVVIWSDNPLSPKCLIHIVPSDPDTIAKIRSHLSQIRSNGSLAGNQGYVYWAAAGIPPKGELATAGAIGELLAQKL